MAVTRGKVYEWRELAYLSCQHCTEAAAFPDLVSCTQRHSRVEEDTEASEVVLVAEDGTSSGTVTRNPNRETVAIERVRLAVDLGS